MSGMFCCEPEPDSGPQELDHPTEDEEDALTLKQRLLNESAAALNEKYATDDEVNSSFMEAESEPSPAAEAEAVTKLQVRWSAVVRQSPRRLNLSLQSP